MEKKMYSVKEVLSFANISRRQLFYYEDKGLIKPVRNSENNYRYYTESEMTKAAFIAEFLGLGFELQGLKNILDSTNTQTIKAAINEARHNARAELNKSIKKYAKCMEIYNELYDGIHFLEYNQKSCFIIGIVDIPPKNIIFYDCMERFSSDTFDYGWHISKLNKIIKQQNLTKLSSVSYLFENHFDPLTQSFNGKPNKVRLFYEINEKLPGYKYYTQFSHCKALAMICKGNYQDDLRSSYKALMQYGVERGIKLKPISLEESVFHPGISYDNPSLWVSKINILIK